MKNLKKKKLKIPMKYTKKINNIISAQKIIRNFLKKQSIFDIKSRTKDLTKTYINSETLLGDPIEKIDKNYFYSVDNFAFDFREIYKNNYKNPYTNLPFDKKIIKQIDRITRHYKSNNISLEYNNKIPSSSKLSTKLSNIFNRLSENNTYPDINTFANYNFYELYNYMLYILQSIIIQKYIDYDDELTLNHLYIKCNNDPKKYEKKFKYFVYSLLEDLVFVEDYNTDIICLILAESIHQDI